jgi:hypothetical protein
MLGFGSLGFGQLPNPEQRIRLDPGPIEFGAQQFGGGMFGGAQFPAVQATSGEAYRIVIERRRCRR